MRLNLKQNSRFPLTPLLPLFLAAAIHGIALPTRAQPAPAGEPARRVEYLPNITYCQIGTQELKLDVAYPKDGEGPFPAIVCVHGGGWHSGSRKVYMGLIRQLAERGYVGVTVDYRLTPRHRFPAQIEDVKCAVRWLRANAIKYKVDPNRIGATGDSAGGHLVGLLAVTSKADGLEGNGGHAEQSSRVQAAVPIYGGFDLAVAYENSFKKQPLAEALYLRFVLEQLLGGPPKSVADKYKTASPVTYVSKDDPPVLLIHGSADTLVLIEQSELFLKKLREAGVEADLLRIEGGKHGFTAEQIEKAQTEALKFFDKHLKGTTTNVVGPPTSRNPTEPSSAAPSPSVIFEKDIAYATVGGMKLHLDLARPAKGDGPFPFVVFIHGGPYADNGRTAWHEEIQEFAKAGYVAASIQYRGPPRGQFKASVEDCKNAVCFLKAHANRYNINPQKGAVYGGSMGGWAALMTALTGPGDGFDANPINQEHSSAVQAVVARYPLTDLTDADAYSINKTAWLILLGMLGTPDHKSRQAREASPINYVDANDPPVLLFHNPKDQAIPFSQSEKLLESLKKAGVPAKLVTLNGRWHASELKGRDPADQQDREMCRRVSLEFLNYHLKTTAASAQPSER